MSTTRLQDSWTEQPGINSNIPKHKNENQSKFIGQKGWVEILMFSLVSSKFLAMRNITLYSVTVATTRPSILVLWSFKDHRYFFVPSREKGNCFSLVDGTIARPSQHFFFNKLVVSQDVLCLLYPFMYGLRTHFQIIDGQNHSPTPNIYFRKFRKTQFFVEKMVA